MKKVCLLLAAIFSMGVFAACNDKTETTDSTVESFYNFEDYDRNLMQVRPFQSFGVITDNKEAEYVSQGESSLKIQPLGEYGTSNKPYLVFPTYSPVYDYNFMDFAQYKCFSGDFYNAEERDIEMEVGLATSQPTYTRLLQWMNTSITEKYVLKPGWNKVVYFVEHDLINISANINQIFGVFVSFDNANSMYTEDAPVLYADNLQLEKLATPYVQAERTYALNKDEEKGVYEIASFEKAYQKYMIWCGQYRHRYAQPDYDIYNPLMGEEVGNVLRFITRPTNLTENNYPWSYISAELFKQYDIEGIKADTANDYYFCFDIYNNSETSVRLGVEYMSSLNDFSQISKTWHEEVVSPKTWATYRHDIKSIDLIVGKDPTTGQSITKKWLDDMGNVRFAWDRYDSGERREFWLDNLRIEKVAKT